MRWGNGCEERDDYAIDRYKAQSGPETMCAICSFEVLRYLQVLFLKNRSVPDMSHRYFEVIRYLQVRYSQVLLYTNCCFLYIMKIMSFFKIYISLLIEVYDYIIKCNLVDQ